MFWKKKKPAVNLVEVYPITGFSEEGWGYNAVHNSNMSVGTYRPVKTMYDALQAAVETVATFPSVDGVDSQPEVVIYKDQKDYDRAVHARDERRRVQYRKSRRKNRS